jgi:hypothetical protein
MTRLRPQTGLKFPEKWFFEEISKILNCLKWIQKRFHFFKRPQIQLK